MEYKPMVSISWSNLIASILIVIAICYTIIKFIKKYIKNN